MPQPKRRALESLRRKTVTYAVVYTLSALLFISAFSILPLVSRLKRSEESNLLHAARIRAVAIEEYLDRITGIARHISSQPVLRQVLALYVREQVTRKEATIFLTPRLTEAMQQSPEVAGMHRIDQQGELLVQSGTPIPSRHWQIPPPGSHEPMVSEPQVIDGMPYLIISMPIRDGSQRLGTDLYLFDAAKLQGIVWDPGTLEEGGDSLLGHIDDQKASIFFPGRLGEREIYNQIAEFPLFRQGLKRARAGETGLLRHPGQGEVPPSIVAYTPVADTDWGLLVTMDQEHLYSGVNRLLFSVTGTVLLLAAAGGIGAFLLLRPLTGKVMVYSTELESLNRELQQEIAERKRVMDNLRRSEREWAETFEAITDAVAILDSKGEVLKMNQAQASFLSSLTCGTPAERRCKVHFGLEKSTEVCPFTQMLKTGAPEFGELYEPHSDRFYHISVYPLRDEAGNLWGGVHIAQDITEQKKMENLKDEMISSVSHEMRTPLTAMLGFTEYLLENPMPPEQAREYLQTVHRETERLNELISNFLDLQRLQAQLENYQIEPLNLSDLLQEAVHLFAIASKRHRLVLDYPAGQPLVRGDAKRLQQVMRNLLSNAIKYSPEGGTITVGATREDGSVRVWVRDEGMGIPPQALSKIFDRFYRVEDGIRRIPGGIGLGLALVREVIRAHGGRVWAESTMGQGSTFYFTLQVAGEGVRSEE